MLTTIYFAEGKQQEQKINSKQQSTKNNSARPQRNKESSVLVDGEEARTKVGPKIYRWISRKEPKLAERQPITLNNLTNNTPVATEKLLYLIWQGKSTKAWPGVTV